jgi:hypothetical protein
MELSSYLTLVISSILVCWLYELWTTGALPRRRDDMGTEFHEVDEAYIPPMPVGCCTGRRGDEAQTP